jgi:hypothetical protein
MTSVEPHPPAAAAHSTSPPTWGATADKATAPPTQIDASAVPPALTGVTTKVSELSTAVTATQADISQAAKAAEEWLAEFAAHTQSQPDQFGRKRDEVTGDTQKFAQDTVLPIDSRVGDLANKVTWLNHAVVAFRAKMDEPGTATASASSLPANFHRMINNVDPVVRRAAFIGFGDV